MLMKKTGRTWFIIYLLVFHDIDKFPNIRGVLAAETEYCDNKNNSMCQNTPHMQKRHAEKLRQIGLENLSKMATKYTKRQPRFDADKGNLTLSWDSCLFDCMALNTYLKSKKGAIWILPKFLNAFFRGIAQVIITNNPITGFLMWVAIFWSNFSVGLLTSLATAVAIVTAWFIGQDNDSITNGLTTYNAVLVGSAVSTLWMALYSEPVSPLLVGMIILGSVLSVYINSGMGNILEHWDLPTLTLPFNIVASILLTVFKPPLALAATTSTSKELGDQRSFNLKSKVTLNSTDVASTLQQIADEKVAKFPTNNVMFYMKDVYVGLQWWKVLEGVIYSIGQVWAVQTFPGSILIYLGVLIYSPIAFTMALIGATVGTLTGLLFVTEPPYTSIYTGIYGYNGILTAIGVGGFFFPLNTYSFLHAFVDIILVTFIQQALSLSFTPVGASVLPVLTFPFCLGAYLFIAVTTHVDYLTRVTEFSYPEKHLEEHLKILREKEMNKTLLGMEMNTDFVTNTGGLSDIIISRELPERSKP